MKNIIIIFLFFPLILFSQQWVDKVPVEERDNFYKQQDEFNKFWAGKTPERGSGWKQFKRWEWFWGPRVFPSGILPRPDILQVRQNEHLQNFPNKIQKSIFAESWSIIGPTVPPVGASYTGIGRLNCIAFHPTTSTTIFVGAASGGLWKSTNSGSSWTTATDNLGTLGVSSISFDPADPNIMYIATGDGDGNSNYSLGVLKSTNGGLTWSATGLNWTSSQTTTINSIIVHPTNSNIIIAATSKGIQKSSDAGTSWTKVLDGYFFKDLEVNITNPTIWYSTSNSIGIYKSTDAGSTWNLVTTGLPSSSYGRIAIAIAKSSPSTVYALYVNSTNGFKGLYKSTNDGVNWTEQSTTPNVLSWDGTGTSGQGYYDLVLDVDPTNPAIIYTGGIDLYKSTNSGVTLTNLTKWYTGAATPYIHADQHGFAFDPTTSSTIYAVNDGGIYKSTNSGTTWSDLSSGISITQYYKIGSSATNSARIYAGSQDNGTHSVVSGTWSAPVGGDGMETIIDYTDQNIGYASIYYGTIYKTTDGSTFSGLTTNAGSGEWVTPYIINPTNPQSLYIGTAQVYKTLNRGGAWSQLGTVSIGGGLIDHIAIAPSDTNTIYFSNAGGFYKSTNNGSTWAQVSTAAGIITGIAVHPANPQLVYITISGYGTTKVQKSTDGGTTLTDISTGLPAIPTNCIAINPGNGNQIVVGTDVGVYYSENSGASWSTYSTGLPNVIITDLEFHVSSSELRVATYGRGLWKTSFTSIPLGSIAGTVFQDVNNNAVYDSGIDYLVSNKTVNLSGTSSATGTTDANGVYTFSSLADGSYTVALASHTGWAQTLPTSNGTYSVTISSANSATGKIFGMYTAPPVATAQSVSLNEDASTSITLTGTDAEGATLTYTVATNPTKGTLTGTAPNLTYTTTANLYGSDSFTFTVSDGSLTTSTATVSITINAVNDAPVATAQSVNVTENNSSSITLSGTDVEGSSLTYAVASNPTKGTLSGTAPNLTFTPTANTTGNDSFTFTVNDGTVSSSAATVSITITAQATPQYALNLNGSTQKGYLSNALFNISSNFTVEMWIFGNSISSGPYLIYQGTNGYNIYFTSSYLYHYDYITGSYPNYAGSTSTISSSNWHHIAITINDAANETKFYINGVLINTASKGLGTGLSAFHLGGTAANSNYFGGKLKDVRIWNVVRTASEISDNAFKQLTGSESGLVAYYAYNQSSGSETLTNSSSNGSALNLTLYGTPTWVTSYAPISSLQSSYTTSPNAIWSAKGTSATVSSNGFWLTSASTLTEANYAVYGNNNTSGESSNDLTGTSCAMRTGRIWYVDATGTVNVSATIDMSVAQGNSGAITTTATNYKLLRRAGTSGDFTVVAEGSSIANTDQVTFGSYTFTDGYYAIGTLNNSTSPLPIELKSFTANIRNGEVYLNWTTATESANFGFDIERKTGISNWIKLGFVKGNGTSTSEKNYSFKDATVNKGKYSYRLKQIDRDGKFQYQNEASVIIGIESGKIALDANYPNPFNPTTKITFMLGTTSHATLKIYDILGKEIITLADGIFESNEPQEFIFNADNIPSGIYFYKLQSNNKTEIKKMVLMK